MEEVAGGAYRRSLRLPRGAGVVELRPRAHGVTARLWLDDPGDREAAVARCRTLLDLDADPAAILAALGDDPLIGARVRAAPGRRIPGGADGFEIAVRAVIGQQVSVAGATTLAGRIAAAHGEPLARPVGGVVRLFPSPAALAAADPADMAMPASRARALLRLAAAVRDGEIDLAPGADPAATGARLLALPGIGPWTVAYVAMRALRDRDAFPAGDLGVRRALEAIGRDGGPRAALALAEAWRPYRAYAVQHLWAGPPHAARSGPASR